MGMWWRLLRCDVSVSQFTAGSNSRVQLKSQRSYNARRGVLLLAVEAKFEIPRGVYGRNIRGRG